MAVKFFELHENGRPVEEARYGKIIGPLLLWKEHPQTREVVEVDDSGNVIRRYSAEECTALLRAMNVY